MVGMKYGCFALFSPKNKIKIKIKQEVKMVALLRGKREREREGRIKQRDGEGGQGTWKGGLEYSYRRSDDLKNI